MVTARPAAGLLVVAASVCGLAAQSIPMPRVPTALPSAVRIQLLSRRADISSRISAHNDKVRDFLPRCGPGTIPVSDNARIAACAAEHQALLAAETLLHEDKRAFADAVAAAERAPCAALEAQVERDRDALDGLTRTMLLTRGELRDATRAAADAQREALTLGGKLLIKGAVKQLADREELADKLWKQIETDSVAIGRSGVDSRAINDRIRRTLDAYVAARTQAELGADLRKVENTLTLASKFKELHTVGSGIYELQQRADGDLRQFLQDPTVQARASDLARQAARNLSEKSELARFAPHYTLAAFVVDYAYQGTKWALALTNVEGQSSALGDEALAMRALQAQVRRTTDKLNACRAGQIDETRVGIWLLAGAAAP